MFKLTQTTTYFWPVTVNLPMDGGKFDKQTFDAEFKRVPQSRLEELRKQVEEGKLNDADLVREVLVGWRGVSDGETEVQFSDTTLAQLLDVPTVAGSVIYSFMESLAGLKRKN